MVSVIVGVILVLVVIKLLVVPLQGQYVPSLKDCLVKDISAVTVTSTTTSTTSTGGVGVDVGMKTEKRSKMENEVLPAKKKTETG